MIVKRYVQFLISCQLQPDFGITIQEEQDGYFCPAINSVERYLNDRKELMIRSTVWEAHFKQ